MLETAWRVTLLTEPAARAVLLLAVLHATVLNLAPEPIPVVAVSIFRGARHLMLVVAYRVQKLTAQVVQAAPVPCNARRVIVRLAVPTPACETNT